MRNLYKRLCWLWLPMAMLVFSHNTKAQTISRYAIDDAVVNQAYPDSTIDKSQLGGNLKVYHFRGTGGTMNEVYSYVKFDISDLSGFQLESANVSYRGKTGDASFNDLFKLALYTVTQDWSGDTLSWIYRPAIGSSKLDTSFLNASSASKTFLQNGKGLMNYVNEELRKGSKTISFAIRSSGKDTTDNMWIGGVANGNYGPVLNCVISNSKSKYAVANAVVMQAYPDSVVSLAALGGNLKAYRKLNTGQTYDQTFSYIKFDISELAGTQLDNASVSYRGKTGDANFNDAFKLGLYTVTQDWSADTVTWQYRPATGSSVLDTSFLNASSASKTFMQKGTVLVDYINEEIRKGSKTVSLAIKSFGKDSTDNMWIGGVDNGAYGPILNFTILPDRSTYAIDDAVVMQAYPDSVIDQSTLGGNILAYKNRNGAALQSTFSFVKFDISELKGQQVESANISYRGKTGDANFTDLFKLGIYSVKAAWDGSTVTYNTKPSTGSVMDTSSLNASSARKTFQTNGSLLVNYINEEIRKGSSTISFAIKSFGKDSTTNMWIGGSANGNYGPILNYTLSAGKSSGYSVDDAVVMQAYPDSIIDQSALGGNLKVYRLRNTEGTMEQTYSYVKFDISGLNGLQMDNATVSYRGLTGDATFSDQFKLGLYGVTQDWQGDTVSWKYKPSVSSTKMDTSFLNTSSASKTFLTNGTRLTDFINEEMRKGNTTIGLAIKSFGKDSTDNMWIGGTANGSYGPILNITFTSNLGAIPPAPVVLDPLGGTYIASVKVMLVNKPAKDSVFYEAGKTNVADPTRSSALFPDNGLVVTDTTILKVIASRDGIYSDINTQTYNILPVEEPKFSPSPAVKYQGQVLVSITVNPPESTILYSLDGSEPGEPYQGPFLLTQTTTVNAKAFSKDYLYETPVVTAVYEIVNTENLPGNGPAGVGYKSLVRTDQPELGLWLKPEALTGLTDGAEAMAWSDMSGNGNNAVNTYTGTPEPIANTGEKTKPAPVFTADALNGFAALNFGVQTGDGNLKMLSVPDADNLDGGGGISIFLVMKRNLMYGDFAACIQKRNITGGDSDQAFSLEMDGGSNPNKMQFVLARDLFLKNSQVLGTDQYYIINVNQQGALKTSSFFQDGHLESTNFYNEPVLNSTAPLLLGGFQPMNVAEVALFNSDLNMAQIVVINNYLAAKYGLTLDGGNQFDPGDYKYDIIGLGKARNITNSADDAQLYSSGGALELKAAAIANNGDFLFAGHNSGDVTEDAFKQWSREYFIQNSNNIPDVTIGFDYGAAGLSTVPDNTYHLLYRATTDENWDDAGVTPTYNSTRKVLSFSPGSLQTGYYTVAKDIAGIDNARQVSSISIYPNPVTDILSIDLRNSTNGRVEYRIYDMTGRMVKMVVDQKAEFGLLKTIDVSSLEKGLYIMEINQNGEKLVRKFNRK